MEKERQATNTCLHCFTKWDDKLVWFRSEWGSNMAAFLYPQCPECGSYYFTRKFKDEEEEEAKWS